MKTFGTISRREFANRVATQMQGLGFASLLGAGCSEGGTAEDKLASSKDGLGPWASLGGKRLFPDDNPWNRDISKEPIDPASDALIACIGRDKPLHPDFGNRFEGDIWGFAYLVVPGKQPKVPIRFVGDPDESDPGPYPIPLDAPIEGGTDRHVIAVDRDNWMLYELFLANPKRDKWEASSGAIFDLSSNKLRPAGWTSANAAGLPVMAGLVRYDEVVEQEAINHALAFTCVHTRRAYVHPARHFASKSKDPKLPPMGMRVRLKADVDLNGFPKAARVILTALKKYGMMVAQNGGDWYLNGAHHPKWNHDDINSLKRIKGRDFEVVKMEKVVTG